MQVVIHTNLALPNQTESAGWLQQGFRAKGIEAVVTGERSTPADIHVIQGPWYAYQDWIGRPGVLFLDRCFYGHERWDISLGWLKPDGSRDFKQKDTPKGQPPKLKPVKTARGSCVVLGDYGRDASGDVEAARKKYPRVYFRAHPRDLNQRVKAIELRGDLGAVWELCDVAVGHSSTVLVDAVLHGLTVHSSDPRHVIQGHQHDRELWAKRLTWCQWNFEELKRGDFVGHLL